MHIKYKNLKKLNMQTLPQECNYGCPNDGDIDVNIDFQISLFTNLQADLHLHLESSKNEASTNSQRLPNVLKQFSVRNNRRNLNPKMDKKKTNSKS